ncbi:hypothetical protein Rsub_12836 [Raphidocelis subcapitata]|uniref:Tbc2 translation factor, chloroplastic n=1 Tax=Raphidocelis subcapitata TaxID=307507 RepID=A0A2V0PK18_9CHLO|nr:hypothetical protein Rsub_12836 [Raphidocelis subcapitata]|eukprot:GBG00145.1 hypothetical protein Rsub_12836 [Raphidocelis subcapitata]
MAVLCAHALLVGVWSRPDACGGSPACLGARTQRVQQRAAPPPPPPPRGSVVPAAARDVHPGGRRSKLVNQRVAERRKRLKASFDAPAREELGEPSDPGFEARLTNAVNAAYGPGKLGRLIEDYGRVMTAYQLGCALALLAGSAAGRVARDAAGGLPAPDSRPRDPEALTARQQRAQERLAACRGYARRCATLLQARLEAASTLDCARAGYSLARLSLHDPALLEQLEGHTTGRLSGAPPEALAGLAVALALGSHRPSDEWLREWRVESFASLGAFNAQELANAAFALATWQVAPSDVWLARWAQVMRQRWGAGPRACPPPALVRAAYALAAMPAPEQVPVTALLAAQAAAASQAGATGEGTQAGSSAQQQKQLGQQQQQQQADRGRRGGKSSSGGGGSGDQRAALLLPPPPDPNAGRVPSFNWTCGFLGALRLAVDALAPGELSTLLWSLARLGHAPDLLFSAAWYRAAAARMGAFRPAELALALHALGALRPGVGVPGGVPGRFVAELLPAARALLPRCSGGQLVAVLWGLAELRLWPGQAWLDDWLAGGWVDFVLWRRTVTGVFYRLVSAAGCALLPR